MPLTSDQVSAKAKHVAQLGLLKRHCPGGSLLTDCAVYVRVSEPGGLSLHRSIGKTRLWHTWIDPPLISCDCKRSFSDHSTIDFVRFSSSAKLSTERQYQRIGR